jgi:lipopolysaccharide export LptBFGC system permease protein LptF
MSGKDPQPQQWHDGRRMVTLWVGRGQQWAGSARDQAQRANRRSRNPIERFAMWLVGIPLGLIGAALGLVLMVLAAVIGVIVLGFMIWAGMGFAGAAMASNKGRPARLGWLLGLTLGPIGLLLIRRLL